jgi:hypothetical protein
MSLPGHLFIGSNGCLYDTRKDNWAAFPIRENYCYTRSTIRTVADIKATLRHGPFAWPGGYPLYFITSDGGTLSFATVRKELRSVVESIRRSISDGWRVIACTENWEHTELTDDHTGERIESAYAD